jgi:hypothetical protein
MVCDAEKVEKALRRAVDSHENLQEALRSLRREMKSFDAKKKCAKFIATKIQVVGGVLTFWFPPAGQLTTLAGTGLDLVTDGVDAYETKECYDRIERYFDTYEREMKQLEYITEMLGKPIATLDSSEELEELNRFRKDLAIRIVRLLIKAGFAVAEGVLVKLGLSASGTVGKTVARGMAVVTIISSVISIVKELKSSHPTISTIDSILVGVEEHRRSLSNLLAKEIPVLKEKERMARLAEEVLRKKRAEIVQRWHQDEQETKNTLFFFGIAFFAAACYVFFSHSYLLSLIFFTLSYLCYVGY